MDADNITLARSVLVDGQPQAAAARAAGVGRQRASQVVKNMLRYVEEANPVPVGWRTNTVTLPVRDWPKVHALEWAARRTRARIDLVDNGLVLHPSPPHVPPEPKQLPRAKSDTLAQPEAATMAKVATQQGKLF